MFRGTIKELQPKLLLNGVAISALNLSVLLTILKDSGLAKIVAKAPTATGKGKPSNIWEVSEDISLKFTEMGYDRDRHGGEKQETPK